MRYAGEIFDDMAEGPTVDTSKITRDYGETAAIPIALPIAAKGLSMLGKASLATKLLDGGKVAGAEAHNEPRDPKLNPIEKFGRLILRGDHGPY